MEQLIILLLVAIGSAVSTYYRKKRKREHEENAGRDPNWRPPAEPPLVPPWPKSGKDWQEELRRVLTGETASPSLPPPIRRRLPPATSSPAAPAKFELPKSGKAIRETSEGDVQFASPLKESSTAYNRASGLAQKVGTRLEAVDAQTKAHRPAQVQTRGLSANAAVLKRWTKNRESLRAAFLASLIFSPPVGLSEDRTKMR